MARVFAVMVQILLRIGVIAVQTWSEPRIYPRLQSKWRALAQSCPGGAERSRESRYKYKRSQESVTMQDLNCGQVRALPAVASAKAGVRVHVSAGFVLGTRVKQKP